MTRTTPAPSGRRTRATLLAAAALAAAALAAVAAASGQAAPKPGFVPGTWIGTGTISGSSADGPLKTVFSGSISFTLKVAPSLAASGSGSWAMTMKGSGPVSSMMKGSAPVQMRGSGSDVRYTGTQKVSGVVSDGTMSRKLSFSRPLSGRLVITRAGTCRVSGSSTTGGVTLSWSAQLQGSGTCRT